MLKRKYIVKYLLSFGSMTINEEEYECMAYCKYHAHKLFLRDCYDKSNHYTDRTVLKSYLRMRKSITRKKI